MCIRDRDKVLEGRNMPSFSHIKVSVAGTASSECNWTEIYVSLAYRFELPVQVVHSTLQSSHRQPLPLKVTPGGVAATSHESIGGRSFPPARTVAWAHRWRTYGPRRGRVDGLETPFRSMSTMRAISSSSTDCFLITSLNRSAPESTCITLSKSASLESSPLSAARVATRL